MSPIPKHCLRVDVRGPDGRLQSSHAFLGDTQQEILARYSNHLHHDALAQAVLARNASEVWVCGDCRGPDAELVQRYMQRVTGSQPEVSRICGFCGSEME